MPWSNKEGERRQNTGDSNEKSPVEDSVGAQCQRKVLRILRLIIDTDTDFNASYGFLLKFNMSWKSQD